jgi:hypothetical protein
VVLPVGVQVAEDAQEVAQLCGELVVAGQLGGEQCREVAAGLVLDLTAVPAHRRRVL